MPHNEQKAPEGKFRIIGADTFDNNDWVESDHTTLEEARKVANERGGKMTMMHIYDDHGNHKGNAGNF